MPSLILASSSKARNMLLQRLGLPFTCYSPDIDETEKPGESPLELVIRLTREKGLAVAKQFSEGLVISGDQVIVVDGEAISKPETREEAVRQLSKQSGKWVEAFAGVGLLNIETESYQFNCVQTRILFRKLTEEQIHKYLAKDEASYHCAGSLRVEALGISLLEKVHSDDPTALIGLPLIALTTMLQEEGVDVLQ